jgi:hypothetical protein
LKTYPSNKSLMMLPSTSSPIFLSINSDIFSSF